MLLIFGCGLLKLTNSFELRTLKCSFAIVAQLVEPLICTEKVIGSSPVGSSKFLPYSILQIDLKRGSRRVETSKVRLRPVYYYLFVKVINGCIR